MRERVASTLFSFQDGARANLLVTAALAAAMLFGVHLLPKGMPGGLYGLGLVMGCQIALGAIGVLLVYRSDRIINFAQVQLGALGGVLFFECVTRKQFIRWGHAVCPPCFPADPRQAGPVLEWANFILALVLGIGSAILIGLIVRVAIVQRFRKQSPLIGTVATLGVVQVLGAVAASAPGWFRTAAERRIARGGGGSAATSAKPPADLSFAWDPYVFNLGEILAVVVTVVAVAALAMFLKRSKLGIGVRASAENQERAATLGMNSERLAARVWIIAGALSGVAAVIGAMTTGSSAIGAVSSGMLLRVFAAVVIAGMESLSVAILLAIAFAIFDQGFLWSFGGGSLVDLIVFGALVIALLVRRARVGGRIDPEGAGWRAAEEARPIPKQLRDLPIVRKARRAGPAALAVIMVAFPWVMSPGDTHQGTIMLFYAMIGLSLLVLTGWAGQMSLGQFAFAAVGGYAAAIVGGSWGWPLPIALLAGALAGSATAVIVGLPALRIRGLYLAVTTLGFAIVTSSVLLGQNFGGKFLPARLQRPVVLGLDTADERIWYYMALAILTGFVVAVIGMRRGRTARALIASRDNERAAQSLGVNLVRARLEAFAVSGFLAAFAGALFAYHQEGVNAGNYSPQASLNMFLLAVIGGLGSFAGPLLGALYVGGLSIFARSFADLGTGVAALLILMFTPAGLTRIVFGLRDTILRRVAERHRLLVPSLRTGAGDAGFRAPIAPKLLPTGGQVPVPVRYRLGLYRPTVEGPAVRKSRRG